jgi:hypothetical protein
MNMNLQNLNNDILNKIYEEVVIQNKDEISIFENKYIIFLKQRGYSNIDFKNIPDEDDKSYDEKHSNVNDWIWEYVYDVLDQNQIDTIICSYGINNALTLLYKFNRNGLGNNADKICIENLDNAHEMETDRVMVELILSEKVNFNLDWKYY